MLLVVGTDALAVGAKLQIINGTGNGRDIFWLP
jgi:hypothetical protein